MVDAPFVFKFLELDGIHFVADVVNILADKQLTDCRRTPKRNDHDDNLIRVYKCDGINYSIDTQQLYFLKQAFAEDFTTEPPPGAPGPAGPDTRYHFKCDGFVRVKFFETLTPVEEEKFRAEHLTTAAEGKSKSIRVHVQQKPSRDAVERVQTQPSALAPTTPMQQPALAKPRPCGVIGCPGCVEWGDCGGYFCDPLGLMLNMVRGQFLYAIPPLQATTAPRVDCLRGVVPGPVLGLP